MPAGGRSRVARTGTAGRRRRTRRSRSGRTRAATAVREEHGVVGGDPDRAVAESGAPSSGPSTGQPSRTAAAPGWSRSTGTPSGLVQVERPDRSARAVEPVDRRRRPGVGAGLVIVVAHEEDPVRPGGRAAAAIAAPRRSGGGRDRHLRVGRLARAGPSRSRPTKARSRTTRRSSSSTSTLMPSSRVSSASATAPRCAVLDLGDPNRRSLRAAPKLVYTSSTATPRSCASRIICSPIGPVIRLYRSGSCRAAVTRVRDREQGEGRQVGVVATWSAIPRPSPSTARSRRPRAWDRARVGARGARAAPGSRRRPEVAGTLADGRRPWPGMGRGEGENGASVTTAATAPRPIRGRRVMAVAWARRGSGQVAVHAEDERRRAGDRGDREEVVGRDPKALRRRAGGENTIVAATLKRSENRPSGRRSKKSGGNRPILPEPP